MTGFNSATRNNYIASTFLAQEPIIPLITLLFLELNQWL